MNEYPTIEKVIYLSHKFWGKLSIDLVKEIETDCTSPNIEKILENTEKVVNELCEIAPVYVFEISLMARDKGLNKSVQFARDIVYEDIRKILKRGLNLTLHESWHEVGFLQTQFASSFEENQVSLKEFILQNLSVFETRLSPFLNSFEELYTSPVHYLDSPDFELARNFIEQRGLFVLLHELGFIKRIADKWNLNDVQIAQVISSMIGKKTNRHYVAESNYTRPTDPKKEMKTTPVLKKLEELAIEIKSEEMKKWVREELFILKDKKKN